ncbi:MAG: Hsp20 family protein [Hyphomicrobiaceae bacterium]
MTRMTLQSNPLLLGFEELERLVERASKTGGDGYPPYNIERIGASEPGDGPERLRITLAVAGFTREQLEIQLEDKHLLIRGKQVDDAPRNFIHRGIAARQFCRTFVLADGLEVHSADLSNGLLAIDLIRIMPARLSRTISIGDKKSNA